jgi:protein transport protein SEC31
MVQRNFNWDIGRERIIKQNMLIGNYEGAIDAALKCGRTA